MYSSKPKNEDGKQYLDNIKF